MANILVREEHLDAGVFELILEKQLKFKQEKKRMVSVPATISRLLREAYRSEIEAIIKEKK